ncbi:MAG: xylulokinase [Pseudomonadota bacterium]
MSIWAGIDIGTSGVKVALFDNGEAMVAEASVRLEVSRPEPGWSEQHPDIWWQAVLAAFDRLAADHPAHLAALGGIGLSGQMLGTVLVDEAGQPVGDTILWNDQRAVAECAELAGAAPEMMRRGLGAPDPGFGAPKLLWLQRNRPEEVARVAMLLLPKDYVRLRLTGETATEPSDAVGLLLMDRATRQWDPAFCAAVDWPMEKLPPVVGSWEAAGSLSADLTRRWGTPADVPVAAGAGDNAAAAIGVGAATAGSAMVTIGTSAVVCGVDAGDHPAPERAVLTTAHAAPDLFLSMGVVMSATASLDWLGRITGVEVPALVALADEAFASGAWRAAPVMRPSFSGIRTPHNRPDVGGIIDGLTHQSDRGLLAYSLLEGVAFQIAECADAQREAGVSFTAASLVGGGARSPLWGQLVATLMDLPLDVPADAALGANLGAARLGRVAATGELARLAAPVPIARTDAPVAGAATALRTRYEDYKALALTPYRRA